MEKKSILINNESIKIFLLAFPGIVFIFLFHYLPLHGWAYALFEYNLGLNLFDCNYVGFKYFTTMFANPILLDQLIRVLRNTLAIAGLGLLFSPLAPIFAILLNEMSSRTYRRVIQSLTTLPHFLSWVILYSLAFFMFSNNTGFVNNLFLELGLIDKPISFLTSRDHVWLTMEAYRLWKELGWAAIVYCASIIGIDPELYEAAIVDGANRFQRIWHITVPGIIPTFFVLLIISIGNFLNVSLDQFLVFQNAMNKEYIEVLDLYVFNQGINGGNISYATATGIMKSLVAVVLFSFANWFSKVVRGYSIF